MIFSGIDICANFCLKKTISSSSAVPAIHRGHPPLSESLPARGTAHDATNLFHRGHYALLESIVEGVLAHGELQEEKSLSPGGIFLGPRPYKGQEVASPIYGALHEGYRYCRDYLNDRHYQTYRRHSAHQAQAFGSSGSSNLHKKIASLED